MVDACEKMLSCICPTLSTPMRTDQLQGGTRHTTIATKVVNNGISTICRLRHLLWCPFHHFKRGCREQEVVGVGAAGKTTAIRAVAESLVVGVSELEGDSESARGKQRNREGQLGMKGKGDEPWWVDGRVCGGRVIVEGMRQ